MITDQHGRNVNYMRISITDRCNLRCFYCRPCESFHNIPHQDLLRYEELLALMKMARNLGVEKIRLTGGEPMVRKDFSQFLQRVHQELPQLDLRLTTNATLLNGQAPLLAQIGLDKINISLDTLRRGKYELITGRDRFVQVRRAIDQCLDHGIAVKVNVVALKGVNDEEMPEFMAFARNLPVDLRFIEFMPIGRDSAWAKQYFWPAGDILRQARDHADLTPFVPDPETHTHGPAQLYTIQGGLGRLGIISPLSNHFCGTCNRLRITSHGSLRTCLFSDKEYRFRAMLRHPKLGIRAVERLFRLAGEAKPVGYVLLKEMARQRPVCHTAMSAIGG
ncbi:MAG: GTP 3',8-cyclase MoaA [Desulfovibrio sp.]|nr:MAG: GTP 3',8-cyclase MoaA [Desulfovibrio sp.]